MSEDLHLTAVEVCAARISAEWLLQVRCRPIDAQLSALLAAMPADEGERFVNQVQQWLAAVGSAPSAGQ
jgi:hypothetical protein